MTQCATMRREVKKIGTLMTLAIAALAATAQEPPEEAAAETVQPESASEIDASSVQPVAQSADAVTAGATRLQLDTTQVTGNRELPKVLVIVPWKNPELVELTGRPLASLVEEVLSPIDPDVFRRQVDYYNALQEDEDAGDGER